jgi:hypothetical protein
MMAGVIRTAFVDATDLGQGGEAFSGTVRQRGGFCKCGFVDLVFLRLLRQAHALEQINVARIGSQ